jgi:hypothetical protein
MAALICFAPICGQLRAKEALSAEKMSGDKIQGTIRILHSAFRILHSAFCILHSAFDRHSPGGFQLRMMEMGLASDMTAVTRNRWPSGDGS